MKTLQRQTGALLVPALIVIIVIVLIVMWQTGLFSAGSASGSTSGTTSPQTNSEIGGVDSTQNATTSPGISATNAVEEMPSTNVPDREFTAGEKAAKRVAEFKARVGNSTPPTQFEMSDAPVATTETGEGAKAASIDQAAALLLTNHAPDFSSCRSVAEREKALECAAGLQTQALNAAFEEHNRLRSAGDEISIQRGGEIMQRVIEGMQRALTPFVEATTGS